MTAQKGREVSKWMGLTKKNPSFNKIWGDSLVGKKSLERGRNGERYWKLLLLMNERC